MYSVRYGGRRGRPVRFELADDLVVVRTRLGPTLGRAVRSRGVAAVLAATERVAHFPEVGVEVLRVRAARRRLRARDAIRRALKREAGIEFAGRVLRDARSKRPVVYTENLFVKFADGVPVSRARRLLASFGIVPRRRLGLARNAWFAAARPGIGLGVFGLASRLLARPEVELCHPELVRPVARRRAFPQQWHLRRTRVAGRVVDAHAGVASAWRLSTGRGVVIAVIDDGIDVDHEEFGSRRKIVAPRDATRRVDDARPVYSGALRSDDHGTACAGVACADGRFGASGVAPEARLMPIRLVSGLGSQNESDAFVWAADHGADVISCSWGPEDGDWSDPSDPLHRQVVPLPDSTRLAIEHAVRTGRGGRGCVITFAAGNGNESVDNDGYASHDQVIAVAACNDRGRRSVYSDHGDAVWCAFPSSDFGPPRPKTPGIWTTDRSGGAGYNPNLGGGDSDGDYTEDFGGTSSACPGVAGVAALVLSANPRLSWDEVRDILARSARKVGRSGGGYRGGRSPFYGHGRVDARRAVELAVGARPAERRRGRLRRARRP
jgi:subtilisin family serine protease